MVYDLQGRRLFEKDYADKRRISVEANLQQYTCNGNDCQQFVFTPLNTKVMVYDLQGRRLFEKDYADKQRDAKQEKACLHLQRGGRLFNHQDLLAGTNPVVIKINITTGFCCSIRKQTETIPHKMG